MEDIYFDNIRQSTSELVYAISQKFFDFPNLMTYMTVRTNDFQRNSEENLIFAMIINLFKNDQMLPDRASKKNVTIINFSANFISLSISDLFNYKNKLFWNL